MSEQLQNNQFAEGASRDPKENIDLAWDMAHAEKPFQDEALVAKEKAISELGIATDGMSTDLSLKVAENLKYDKENYDINPPVRATGDLQAQVVAAAQMDQERAIRYAEADLDDVRTLKEKADVASKLQIEILDKISELEARIAAS